MCDNPYPQNSTVNRGGREINKNSIDNDLARQTKEQ